MKSNNFHAQPGSILNLSEAAKTNRTMKSISKISKLSVQRKISVRGKTKRKRRAYNSSIKTSKATLCKLRRMVAL
jgi:hypothetical protein